MTLMQLARASKDDLEAIAKALESEPELANFITELMFQVASIPYVCGNEDCANAGCAATRDAHQTVRELLQRVTTNSPSGRE